MYKTMKKLLLILLAANMSLTSFAQTARQILDKTAQVIGNKNGACANFKVSGSKVGNANGTIAIKGNKFNARTAQAIVWFDGKTQWSYLKKTNEVNVSTPTQAQQMSMNPYTFINMYKTGYTMDLKSSGANYLVHLKAQNQKRSVAELYITIDKKSYIPSLVKMRQGTAWTTICISGFQTKKISNSSFSFNKKEFPSAEIVDLR